MPSKNTPIISVILPVYNGEAHLSECIESVINQSFKNFEFIIVDDASTDKTTQILQKFATQDNRIKIITHAVNQKQTTAANTAIKNARGKYLARMDADDIALSQRFAKQVQFLEDNPQVGIVGSWFNTIDDSGKVIEIIYTNQSPEYLSWNLLFDTSFGHSTVMMRKNTVEKVGYYQSPEAEDFDLWSRINRVAKVANLPEILQERRVWSGQLALKVPTETRDCVLQIMQKNMQYLLNSLVKLETVRAIRNATENRPQNFNTKDLSNAFNLVKKLYKTYLSQNILSASDKKKITKDAYRKLFILTNWQATINKTQSTIQKGYLAYRFPKLYLYSMGFHKI